MCFHCYCSVGHSALDLADMTDRLPEWYKTEMEDMLLKRFEYEFHSANYHALVEVITGLRTVIGHLIKVSLSLSLSLSLSYTHTHIHTTHTCTDTHLEYTSIL